MNSNRKKCAVTNTTLESEKPFSQRLREWRGKLRQKEAAQLLGINPRTYGHWEEGWSKPTSDLSIREIEQRMKETAAR